MWALKHVLVLLPAFLMSALCSYSLLLKGLLVTPVNVSFFPLCVSIMVASYITQLVKHLPPTGQLWGLQLHPGCSTTSVCLLSILLSCDQILSEPCLAFAYSWFSHSVSWRACVRGCWGRRSFPARWGSPYPPYSWHLSRRVGWTMWVTFFLFVFVGT